MRPDVKLGVAISLVVVFVAGGYYLYRDMREKPIPLASGQPGGDFPSRDRQGAVHSNVKQSVPSQARPAAKSAKSTPKAKPVGKKGSRRTNLRETPKIAKRTSVPKSAKPTTTTGSTAGKKATATLAQGSGGKKGSRPKGSRRGRSNRGTKSPIGEAPATSGPGSNTKLAQKDAGSSPGPASRRQPQRTGGAAKRRATPQPSGSTPGGVESVAGAPRTSNSRPSSVASESTVRRDAAVETHRIQAGDTFSALAVAYYGHEKYTKFLVDSNPQIDDPRRLNIGARIKIPPAPPALGHRDVWDGFPTRASHRLKTGATLTRATPRTASVDTKTAGRTTYRVEPGDSFYGIARKVLADSSRWEEVYALNRDLVGGDPKKLQVGQVLVLPNH